MYGLRTTVQDVKLEDDQVQLSLLVEEAVSFLPSFLRPSANQDAEYDLYCRSDRMARGFPCCLERGVHRETSCKFFDASSLDSSFESLPVLFVVLTFQELEEASKEILERLQNGPAAQASPDDDEPSYEAHLEEGEEEEEVEMPTRQMASASLEGEFSLPPASSLDEPKLRKSRFPISWLTSILLRLQLFRNRLSAGWARLELMICPSLHHL